MFYKCLMANKHITFRSLLENHTPYSFKFEYLLRRYKANCQLILFFLYNLPVVIKIIQGNLKGESVVVAILPSCMEVSYCTSGFFHS